MLRAGGYTILGRNVVTAAGEADILAQDPDGRTIVVVEVKTRARGRTHRADAIPPEAAVDRPKKRRLRAILRLLASANGWNDRPKRIDVVAVEVSPGGPPAMRHARGVA
jgi:putative endonuclease